MNKFAVSAFAVCFFGLCYPIDSEAQNLEQGKSVYGRLCSSCHGDSGKGDGPVGRSLPAATIPDLTTAQMKYATDDERMAELIEKGGVAVGLSPLMPPQPGINPADLQAVVAYVNSLKSGETPANPDSQNQEDS